MINLLNESGDKAFQVVLPEFVGMYSVHGMEQYAEKIPKYSRKEGPKVSLASKQNDGCTAGLEESPLPILHIVLRDRFC